MLQSYNFVVLTLPRQASISLGLWSNTWGVADSMIMKKRKRLFVNGCECKSPISTATEFLNSFQDGKNASVCSGIELKNDYSLVAEMSYIYHCNNFKLNFYDLGNLTYWTTLESFLGSQYRIFIYFYLSFPDKLLINWWIFINLLALFAIIPLNYYHFSQY
jgi:hypothetical protein